MPFRPPLTIAQLHEIGVRKQAVDVVPLLWEIKRLQAIVKRAYQLEQSLGAYEGGTAVCMIVRCLRSEIENEPCLDEHKKLCADIVNAKA